jgi:hypothetical protein
MRPVNRNLYVIIIVFSVLFGGIIWALTEVMLINC